MDRFTISLDEELAREFDRFIAERGYRNRSEAVRDLLRKQLDAYRFERNEAQFCVANLSYVYNHHERDLAERLTSLQHDHHDLTVSTMHTHLDHASCMESVILRGPTAAVRRFADVMTAENGVRHGLLNIVSLAVDKRPHAHRHEHASGDPPHRHTHLKPAL